VPNIEIHGLDEKGAKDIYDRIIAVFRGRPYFDDMVVTIYPTKVYDLAGNTQPFLRLVNSHQEHTDEIMHVLEVLHMDIERGKLEEFRPKK